MAKKKRGRKKIKLTKQQKLERKERKAAKQKQYLKNLRIGGVVDEMRKLPTRDRNSLISSYEGDYALEFRVRVGPRLNEEHHDFNWLYWGDGR